MRIASVGHAVFAGTMIALGILGPINSYYAPIWTPIWPQMPQVAPALTYLCAIISLACGVGLLLRRTAATAARVLFVYLVLWLLLVRVPSFFQTRTVEYWWAVSKVAVMGAAAWVLYVWFADDWDRRRVSFAIGRD